ncbi:ornithine cyclodeaminase family protein [Sphingorhabdus sp.]|jgi:alanine dehydrogenase|uniref:ornithine cyclodeaminase family protein n=1 Tax=Sphingorhabdus sp. TaxID=1902408 RepID=UPI0037CBA66C
MPLLITHEEVRQAVSMADAIDAMEAAFLEEGEGHCILPQRINMPVNNGWLRVGPVAMEKSGWMGFKAMNLTKGWGVRYQVHLYRIETGELLAIIDAQHLTTLRTGATSAVATLLLARPGKAVTALLGSGPEARAQLHAMQAIGFVSEARVFSPTAVNREQLARDFADEYGMVIRPVASAMEACDGASLILAAVKSTEPVIDGAWLQPGAHVNSVGTARRDQRELDIETFRRASRIVVDTREGVFGEAGDAVAAADVVSPASVSELHELVAGKSAKRMADDEITLFKSVGTGIQDIALAAAIYQRALDQGLGTDLGEFPYLKRNAK